MTGEAAVLEKHPEGVGEKLGTMWGKEKVVSVAPPGPLSLLQKDLGVGYFYPGFGEGMFVFVWGGHT